MNNRELERVLKSARIPERSDGYWKEFPALVSRAARRQIASSQAVEESHRFTLRWAGGLAAACLVAGFWFGFYHGHSAAKHEDFAAIHKCFLEIESMFPNQVRAVIFEKGEPRLELSGAPDVPASVPVIVRFREGKSSTLALTFSGQRIRIGGQLLEVLTGGSGEVILVGADSVWSSAEPKAGKARIDAKVLSL